MNTKACENVICACVCVRVCVCACACASACVLVGLSMISTAIITIMVLCARPHYSYVCVSVCGAFRASCSPATHAALSTGILNAWSNEKWQLEEDFQGILHPVPKPRLLKQPNYLPIESIAKKNLTRLATMLGRMSLRSLIARKTSIRFSDCKRAIMLAAAMKTPVLPRPSLDDKDWNIIIWNWYRFRCCSLLIGELSTTSS